MNKYTYKGDHPMRVVKGQRIGAVTFLANGQRFEGLLPVGEWDVRGGCNLKEGRGSNRLMTAVKIVSAKHGTWYVGFASVCTCGMWEQGGPHGIECVLAEKLGGCGAGLLCWSDPED